MKRLLVRLELTFTSINTIHSLVQEKQAEIEKMLQELLLGRGKLME